MGKLINYILIYTLNMIVHTTNINIWFKTAVGVHMLSKAGAFNPNSSTSALLQLKQMYCSSSNVIDRFGKKSSSIRFVLQLLILNFLLTNHSDYYSWKIQNEFSIILLFYLIFNLFNEHFKQTFSFIKLQPPQFKII